MSYTAYKLIPSFQNLNLVSNGAQITCLACSDHCIYVGTNDGSVMRFTYEELSDETNKKYYFYDKTDGRFLGQRKRVLSIRLSLVYNYLIVLFDETLVFLREDNLDVLPPVTKLRGITCFHLREGTTRDENLSSHLCLGLKKKTVQLYAILEDRLQHLSDVSVPDIPITLNFDGTLICAGLSDRYYITEFEKHEGQEVFTFEPNHVKPMVLHVAKGEFLLNGPNGLGISASYGAESKRPPILLNNSMVDMIMQNPFIVALNDEFITIHSTLQGCEQKQSIKFSDGRCLAYTATRVFAASGQQLSALIPVPWTDQASELLEREEIDAALHLCELERRRQRDTIRFQEACCVVLQQAGFVYFKQMNFKEARKQFDNGRLYMPELIRLYPDLLPSEETIPSSVHYSVPDVMNLTKNGSDEAKLKKYKEFLSEFLVEHRESELGRPHRRLVDIALLKLYADIKKPEEFEVLLQICDITTSDVFDVSNYLISGGKHHAAALILRHQKMVSDAMNIWKKLVDGEVTDRNFPGLNFVVQFMKEIPDDDIISRHAHWIIDKNADKAVEIFIIHGPSTAKGLSPDAILDRLCPNNQHSIASLTYLEYLVDVQKLTNERYHTQLASHYIEMCSDSEFQNSLRQKLGTDSKSLRIKCRRFLQKSDHYRVQYVQDKLSRTTLKVETAIVYGKLGDHDGALRILARELGEYEEARRYCLNYGTTLPIRRKLFESLLRIYLEPSEPECDLLIGPAIELLNNHESVFNAAQVLKRLPDAWSVSVVSQFLNSSLRDAMHSRRQASIRRGLYAGQLQELKDELASVRNRRFVLDAETRCPACGENFIESDCTMTPDVGLVHTHCAQ